MKGRHQFDDQDRDDSHDDFDLHHDSAPLEHGSFAALQPLIADFVWVPTIHAGLPVWTTKPVTESGVTPHLHFPKPVATDQPLAAGIAAAPPPSSVTQAQVDALKSGFTQELTQIESNLGVQAFAENLPIVGTHLKDAFDAGNPALHGVTAFRDAVVAGLNSLAGGGPYSPAMVQSAINNGLASAGFANPATVSMNGSDVHVDFGNGHSYGNIAVPISTDLGLPNLGLHASGNATTQLTYVFGLSAGVDGAGFYLDTSADRGFYVDDTTTLPGLNTSADLGPAHFTATDGTTPTNFDGRLEVVLKDPGGDGKLRLNELAGSPDLLDATLGGAANINLALAGSVPASGTFPSLSTNLKVLWVFPAGSAVDPADNNSSFGDAPEVRFNDSKLNLGSFFSHFASPILHEITTVTSPLQPVIDVLTTPIPILVSLGSPKTSLLDFAGIGPAALQGYLEVSTLGGKVDTYTQDDLTNIDLGSLLVADDIRSTSAEDALISIVRVPAPPSNQAMDAAEFVNALNIPGGGLSFPILTDPKTIGKLLLGKDPNLFDYNTGNFGFDLGFSQYFPVLGFAGVKLGGHFGMQADLDFGFDTQGLKDYASGGYTDRAKLFNGFFVQGTDEGGNPVTGFQISASVIAGIQANVGFGSAGIDGDLTANVDFALDGSLDPAGLGRVRGETLTNTPINDLFDPKGELTGGLHAYLEVGISPFSVSFSFDSPRFTLLNFDGNDVAHPVIASDFGGGELALNVGPRAPYRLYGNITDRGEAVQVHKHPLFPDSQLILTGYKFSEVHDVPDHITADGGDHADELTLDDDVNVPAIFHGGANRDFLTGGSAADMLFGDDGPDALSGNGGADELHGGAGNDKLIGGAGGDLLDGGDGQDTASYETATAGMTIDLRTMTFTGDAVGDTFVSIERYEGTNYDDTIDGDDNFNGLLSGLDGNDVIHGNGGDDLIDGGKGDDMIFGDAGNDFLIGGPGADTIDGGPGIDTLSYTSSKTPVAVSLLTGMGTGGDAQGDVISNVEILIGSPLPFGDLTSHYDIAGHPLVAGTGDTLIGSDGNDTISGLGGADFIDGGAGNDMLYGDSADINGPIDSTIGFDVDTLRGGPGDDMLFGQEDDDDLDGGPGHDMLDGGDGNDHLHTMDLSSVDVLDGGSGNNRLSADYSDKNVPINFVAGVLSNFDFPDGDTAHNFQNVGTFYTGSANDSIILDNAADDFYNNDIRTNGGNDLVRSGGGNDTVYGGDGNDTIYAGSNNGSGHDVVDAGPGDDFVNGGSNNAVLTFDSFAFPIGFTVAGDTLAGGPGTDTLSFEGFSKPIPNSNILLGVTIDLANSSATGGAMGTTISGFENVIGTNYADALYGDDGPNWFDPLRGGGLVSAVTGGPDHIDGRGGEDTLHLDFSRWDDPGYGGINVNGGFVARFNAAGNDYADSYTYENIEHVEFTGASKNDLFYPIARNYSDTIVGNGGDDTLGGNGGADTISGGDGNDNISAQGTLAFSYDGTAGGHDVLDGGPGNDRVEDIAFVNGTTYLAADALFQLDGGSGFDKLSADFSNQSVGIAWTSDAPSEMTFADGAYFKGFEQLINFASGSGNDSIMQHGRVDNFFSLGDGNDVVNPGIGNDSVWGGAGEDAIVLDFTVGDTPTAGGVIFGSPSFGAPDGGTASRYDPATGLTDSLLFRGFEHVNLTGTSHDDYLVGVQTGSDHILGLAGNDTLDGAFYGGDYLDGGDGNDTINGSYDNDTLIGGAGDDTISPRGGSDVADGGPGNDIISFTEYPSGGYGTDVWNGGDGNDVIADGIFNGGYTYTNVGPTMLQLDGGAGFDTLSADFGNQTAPITFVGGVSNSMDFPDGSYFRNFEALGSFTSGSGNDTFILPGRVNQNLGAGDGNDTINPGVGIDFASGGAGDDLLILDYSVGDDANVSGVMPYGSALQRVDINTGAVIDQIYMPYFEHVHLTGGSKDDVLPGTDGADILVGGAGNDTLNGYYDNDVIDAGPGNDHVSVSLTFGLFDKLDGGPGFDVLDSADFSNQTAPVIFDSTAPSDTNFPDGAYMRGFEQIGTLYTGSGNDSLTQLGRVNNFWQLNGGNNTAAPGLGIDSVLAGQGDDLLIVDYSVGDDATVTGIESSYDGRFIDRRNISTGSYVDYVVSSGFDRMQIIATTKNDSINGFSGDDVINVLRGNDTVDGHGGTDLLILDWSAMTSGTEGAHYTAFDAAGGSGTLTTSDASNFSVTYSGIERFNLTGTGLADDLRGGAGNDVINAGYGDDLLDGGAGADTMTGGAGNDIYVVDDPGDVINESAGGGYDTVIFTIGGSLTQPANVEKIIFTHSTTIPSLNIGPNGLVIVDAEAVPPAAPASAAVGAMLAADSGLSEIARLQALAGTPAVQIPNARTIDALAEITVGVAHDTTADIAIAHPTIPFPELFAPDFTTDPDTTHDVWHHEPALAPLDFDVIDAIV